MHDAKQRERKMIFFIFDERVACAFYLYMVFNRRVNADMFNMVSVLIFFKLVFAKNFHSGNNEHSGLQTEKMYARGETTGIFLLLLKHSVWYKWSVGWFSTKAVFKNRKRLIIFGCFSTAFVSFISEGKNMSKAQRFSLSFLF